MGFIWRLGELTTLHSDAWLLQYPFRMVDLAFEYDKGRSLASPSSAPTFSHTRSERRWVTPTARTVGTEALQPQNSCSPVKRLTTFLVLPKADYPNAIASTGLDSPLVSPSLSERPRRLNDARISAPQWRFQIQKPILFASHLVPQIDASTLQSSECFLPFLLRRLHGTKTDQQTTNHCIGFV